MEEETNTEPRVYNLDPNPVTNTTPPKAANSRNEWIAILVGIGGGLYGLAAIILPLILIGLGLVGMYLLFSDPAFQ